MTSMDIAVLQLLTEVIVSSKKCGGRHPVSMRTIPISQAMMHGWVKIFLSISFLVGASVNTVMPPYHIIIRCGIR